MKKMKANKMKVVVESDLSEVKNDLAELQTQLESVANTVERLNDNGVNIKLKMNVDTNKMKKLFSFYHRG